MNVISKIILTFLALLALAFLIFFTFISDGYTSDFVSKSEYSNLGVYKIDIENNFKLSKLEKSENYHALKLHHVSFGNNIFYKDGDLKIHDNDGQQNIYLEKGIFYFDINDISTQYSIYFDGYIVKNMGPGSFIINTTDNNKKSVFSLSSKLNITFLDINTSEGLAQIDLFPNMYLMAIPRYNKSVKNADLGKIITSHTIDMLSAPIYSSKIDSIGNEIILHPDLKKFLFYNEENYNYFINDIFNFNNQQTNSKISEYSKLSKNDFYVFPGTKYILQYYEYFLNDEKKKFYYKNIILRELIQLLGSKNNNDSGINNIISKMGELKALDIDQYDDMLSHILYYYNNIIYSQKKNPEIITNISVLKEKLLTKSFKQHQPSLLQLRYIYDEYHRGNMQLFHKEMNAFVSNYEKEMNLSIYNEEHKIHNYFLYFLKNIFVGDFSKVKDHNQMVILFKKYIEINELFIQQGDEIIKKTALYDNAALIKVFINIMKISFFQDTRTENLLVLQKPAKITQTNYDILKVNLQLLLDFQKQYKHLIVNSENRKDIILALSYLKYNKELSEYFEALTDYNRYELNHSKITIDLPELIDENQLTNEKAQEYLKQFIGVNSPNTIINIRNYSYCISNDESTIMNGDNYCYEIKDFYVKGFKFNFFLTPFDKNKVSFLNYYDNENVFHNENIEHIMDNIKIGLDRLYENAKIADRDKYNFSRFFINKYVNAGMKDNIDITIQDTLDPFEITDILDESVAARDLKFKLLTKNSPLEKIRYFLPISYKYIKIIEENKNFIGLIYPTTFNIKLSENNKMQSYTGKFEGKYIFKGNNHSFIESKIYIENTGNNKKYSYYLDTQAIHISGNIFLTDTQSILEKVLVNFNKINNLYSTLKSHYKTEKIIISYLIEDNIIQFTVSNTYIFNIKSTGAMDIYKNNSKIHTGRFSQLKKFLEQLP